MSATSTQPMLRMRSITKRFPGTLALDAVDLDAGGGTIHGLLGENGAGKSTLLKILAGDYQASEGTIEIDGELASIENPRKARALGIGIVYQEMSLLPNLTVAQNISLGVEPTQNGRIDTRAMTHGARETLESIGVAAVDPDSKVGTLSLAERQLVEIARVLTIQRPKVLVFDEPTTTLNHHDVVRLFSILTRLREQGVAVIFVSHRYREVLEICDACTVLRNGRRVGGLTREEASVERLVELTLGQKAETAFARAPRPEVTSPPVVQVSDLAIGSRVHDVAFSVSPGEIVSLCGLLGMGQTEVARALLGEGFDIRGSVDMGGSTGVPTSPRDAIRRGVGFIPESRQEEGLFPDMSVRANVSVSSLSRLVVAPFLRILAFSRERRLVREVAERTELAPRVLSRPMRTLSGGNQQKGLLARWLMRGCALLICIEPTRGVDVGAKVEIYRQLEALAASGAAVVVVSTDLPEILGISDRVLVFYRGTIIDELDPRAVSEQDLLLAMQGGAEGETSGLLHPEGVA
jgi:ABC-type sugar transport system ATPase subunit